MFGLISSTVEGSEILDEIEWESVERVMGDPLGICLPRNLENFLIKPQQDSIGCERRDEERRGFPSCTD